MWLEWLLTFLRPILIPPSHCVFPVMPFSQGTVTLTPRASCSSLASKQQKQDQVGLFIVLEWLLSC
jgi:hypothetical protein